MNLKGIFLPKESFEKVEFFAALMDQLYVTPGRKPWKNIGVSQLPKAPSAGQAVKRFYLPLKLILTKNSGRFGTKHVSWNLVKRDNCGKYRWTERLSKERESNQSWSALIQQHWLVCYVKELQASTCAYIRIMASLYSMHMCKAGFACIPSRPDWSKGAGWEFDSVPGHTVHAQHQAAHFVGLPLFVGVKGICLLWICSTMFILEESYYSYRIKKKIGTSKTVTSVFVCWLFKVWTVKNSLLTLNHCTCKCSRLDKQNGWQAMAPFKKRIGCRVGWNVQMIIFRNQLNQKDQKMSHTHWVKYPTWPDGLLNTVFLRCTVCLSVSRVRITFKRENKNW